MDSILWTARQPLLLYNYLRTNTLQMFFVILFLNVWIYKLNGLKMHLGKEDAGAACRSETELQRAEMDKILNVLCAF